MSRVKLNKKDQIKFLNNIREKNKINWSELANILNVHYRCLSDWKQGKYTLPENIFKKLVKLAIKKKIEIPSYKILPNFWNIKKAAKMGGIALSQKYGGPGTFNGRKKGGQISQIRRRLNPELYQHCNLRKDIHKPKKSNKLAELFGIILGDGGITDGQMTITLNRKKDKEYVFHVFKLIEKLFKIKPAIYKLNSRGHEMVTRIVISNKNFVDFLLFMGLKKGSKVKQQVDVPDWIKNKLNFSINCLRGLIDTDGCVYIHKHKCNNRQSFNIGLQLSNKSIPILIFAKETLSILGFNPKINKVGINLYRELEILDYVKKIKLNNPRNMKKINEFLKIKNIRRGV